MTLFTAEGLLRANTFLQGKEDLPDSEKHDIVRRYVHSAYKRWFRTQSKLVENYQRRNTDTGLITISELFARRAPGNTCMYALQQTPLGLTAMNDSKGCGGVMRVAPVGLLFPPEEAFRIGCETAAITHGHKTGIYSSGFLAMVISLLVEGSGLRSAVYRTSTFMLNTVRGYEETLNAVNLALQYAQGTEHTEATVTAVGGRGGWIAEEALAIGIYCAMAASDDFERGIALAVNHSGDSDSTGSITGQILGVMLGESAIPAKFLERLELSETIGNLANDLFTGYSSESSWQERYHEELAQQTPPQIMTTPTIIGAVAGDIIGSIYEPRSKNIKTTEFELLASNTYFTDDTVLTMAVADCLLHGKDFAHTIWEYGRNYPGRGYGRNFKAWLENDTPQPMDSFGNGSAMRVSAVGFACKTIDEVLEIAKQSAQVSHNHPEGIKGAQAIAASVFLAHSGKSKVEIQTYITETFGYNLDFTIDGIRPTYQFDVSCQGSVPQAIVAFLESTDFENAIRLAISIGGDSDTIASMAGAIAAAYYKEIPKEILDFVRGKLPAEFLLIIRKCDQMIAQKPLKSSLPQ